MSMDVSEQDLLASDSSESASNDSASSSMESDGLPDAHTWLPASYKDTDWVIDSSDSGEEADTESSDEEDTESSSEEEMGHRRRLGGVRMVREIVEDMYSQRYEKARDPLPRGPSFLAHVLHVLKQSRPDLFRQELRVSPETFDQIIAKLTTDPVFTNNSRNAQLPIEQQLAIVLFRFGHDGNAASLQKVANWAGVGKGTVLLVTQRVMTAILRRSFMSEAVCMPTMEEKEEAKAWIEKHSCKAWRSGWCFVDGTLVPLYSRPYWYGESYFDRKCNYSLNVQASLHFVFELKVILNFLQIISLPNLRIIDFGYGFTGSTHDSTAWSHTRLAQEHEQLLSDGEFVWADSAYPVRFTMAPTFL